MASTIRDVAIRIAIKTDFGGLKIPDLSKPVKELVSMEKVAKMTGTGLTRGFKKVGGETKKLEGNLKKVADRAAEARAKIRDSATQSGDALSAASEGGMKMVNALTQLGLTADSDVQLVAQRLGMMQAGVDSLTGGISVIQGVSGALKGLSVVSGTAATSSTILSGAQGVQATTAGAAAVATSAKSSAETRSTATAATNTVANTALSASNLTLAGTATVATGAMAALWAATGPVGLVILGAGAAAISTTYYFERLRSSAKKTSADIEGVRKQVQALGGAMTTQGIRADIDKYGMLIDAGVNQQLNQVKRANLVRERLAKLQPLAESNFGLDSLMGNATRQDSQLAFNRAKETAELMRSQLDFTKQLNAEKNKGIEAEKKQLETADQNLRKLRERLEAQKNAFLSTDERIGRLSVADRREVQRISQKKAAGGKLNRREVEFIETKLGPAAEKFVKDFFQQLGAKFRQTNGDVATPFRANPNATGGSQFGATREEIIQPLQRSSQNIAQAIQQETLRLAAKEKAVQEAFQRVIETQIEQLKTMELRLTGIEQGLDRRKASSASWFAS